MTSASHITLPRLIISELIWIIRIIVLPLQWIYQRPLTKSLTAYLFPSWKLMALPKAQLNLIRSYLHDRLQPIRIGNNYSDWKTIQHGIPQGSILGPLLFNLFINDLTYFVNDAKLRLYADDTTLYLSHSNQYALESRSQSKFDVLQSWFKCNYLRWFLSFALRIPTAHD